MTLLSVILYGFALLYKNFKVWQFTGSFPGKNFTPNFKNFFDNSAESFHQELTRLWATHGKDKFVTWIGFERFVAVSNLRDVQASESELTLCRFDTFLTFGECQCRECNLNSKQQLFDGRISFPSVVTPTQCSRLKLIFHNLRIFVSISSQLI
jgi:hypothetical protein